METATLPAGDYAIVEMFGHTKLVGRMAEAERFGVKLLALEPILCGQLLPAMMIGGAAIYCLTPCSAEVALAKAPKSTWNLPSSLQAIIPPAMLPAPEREIDKDEPVFAPRFLNDEDNEIEQRAEAEDNASFEPAPMKPQPHARDCDCAACEDERPF